MTRLRSHHHPKVTRALFEPRWFAVCGMCGWCRTADDWHTAYFTARDHAESSLR
jgi:hypothetical protein